jgi:hypothetical protein
MRDVIIEGTNVQVQGTDAMNEYVDSMALVRTAMRRDLEVNDGI